MRYLETKTTTQTIDLDWTESLICYLYSHTDIDTRAHTTHKQPEMFKGTT